MEDLHINYKTIINNHIIELIYGVDDIVLPGHILKDDLGLDSIDRAELCSSLEVTFNIELQDSFMEWRFVQDIYDNVETLLKTFIKNEHL